MANFQSVVNKYGFQQSNKKQIPVIGLIFVAIAILLMPALYFFEKLVPEPHEKYNYKEIVQHGESVKARITNVQVKKNMTINNVNPRIISYDYIYRGKLFTDKFQTLEFEQLDTLVKKDSITVLVWNGKSVVSNLKPVFFPFFIFWMIPVLFLFIGLPMACMGKFRKEK